MNDEEAKRLIAHLKLENRYLAVVARGERLCHDLAVKESECALKQIAGAIPPTAIWLSWHGIGPKKVVEQVIKVLKECQAIDR